MSRKRGILFVEISFIWSSFLWNGWRIFFYLLSIQRLNSWLFLPTGKFYRSIYFSHSDQWSVIERELFMNWNISNAVFGRDPRLTAYDVRSLYRRSIIRRKRPSIRPMIRVVQETGEKIHMVERVREGGGKGRNGRVSRLEKCRG